MRIHHCFYVLAFEPLTDPESLVEQVDVAVRRHQADERAAAAVEDVFANQNVGALPLAFQIQRPDEVELEHVDGGPNLGRGVVFVNRKPDVPQLT